jgi:lysozyme
MSKRMRVLALLGRPIEWPCPKTAVEAIAMEEDCRLKAYLCTASKATNGWGETDGVRLGMVWTQEYADERFRLSLVKWTDAVKRFIGDAPTTDNQLSAMLCLAYNIGLAAFEKSTVLRLHKKGDYAGAARAFHLFNKSRQNGVLLENPVLVGRRQREAAIYSTPDDSDELQAMPQAVETQSKLSQSPVMMSGVVGAASGVVTVLKGTLDTVTDATQKVSEVAGTFQMSPLIVLGLIIVAVGATSAYWRWKQREGGWV